jgi:hypothetical protein
MLRYRPQRVSLNALLAIHFGPVEVAACEEEPTFCVVRRSPGLPIRGRCAQSGRRKQALRSESRNSL